MYIRVLIPQNFVALAEAVPIVTMSDSKNLIAPRVCICLSWFFKSQSIFCACHRILDKSAYQIFFLIFQPKIFLGYSKEPSQ